MSISDTTLVSLADLAAADVWLRPIEGATIVHELVRQVSRGDLPGVPSAHVIRLGGNGRVTVEGPVAAGGRAVSRAAQLLETLLPGFDAPPERRVPGALRLVVARALGSLDLPSYPTLESFAESLARFVSPEPDVLIRELVTGWAAANEIQRAAAASEPSAAPVQEMATVRQLTSLRQDAVPPSPATEDAHAQLTISDIRRARRATGLTLADIAERSRIPEWLLRELEWGYLRNWPAGHYGRTQLVRYARASGLDDDLVIHTVWPMLERDARAHGAAIIPAVAPDGGTVDDGVIDDGAVAGRVIDGVVAEDDWQEQEVIGTAVALKAQPPASAPAAMARRNRVLAALAIPALLAIGLAPALWNRGSGAAPVTETSVVARGGAADDGARAKAAPVAPPSDRPAAPIAVEPVPASAAPAATTVAAVPAPDAVAAARPAGQDPERVLPDASVYSPSFASAGSAMFYHADSGSESKLMRADTDSGGAILRVTSVVDDDARNFHARPSPDGDRIAFDSDREGERAVYVADADGKNVRRVSGSGFAAIPSWSPDGRSIAYVRAEADRPRVWNLWITDLRSGDERRLTSFRFGQPWGGSWFPDGKRIAYSHETRLIVQDLGTGRERIYQSPIKGRLVRTPAVSPDGRRILFQVYRDGAWLLDLADGSMRRILSDPSAEEYTWAPDGRRVAYHSRRSGNWGVWVMASR